MSFTHLGPEDYSIHLFGLIAHGYHFASLVRHIAQGDPYNSDFEKMLLHHVATNAMMIVGNYSGNHRWGAVIVLLHDAVDIFVCIARVFNSIEGTKWLAVWFGYIPLIFIYPYLKMFYFGWLNYGIWFVVTYPEDRIWMKPYLHCHTFLNTCLWVLHIIWYKGIIDIGLNIVNSGKYIDTINNVTISCHSPVSG